jgi:hypothetical protein
VALALLLPRAARAGSAIRVHGVGPGLLLAIGGYFLPNTLGAVPILHAPALRSWFPGVVWSLKGGEGYRVLLENNTGEDRSLREPYARFPGPHAHLEGILGLESGRRLFAQPGWDPHPYHVFRDVYVHNGVWRRLALEKWRLSEMEEELRGWGVRRLVVWSGQAKDLFAKDREKFPVVARYGPFEVLEYRDAEPAGVAVDSGTAEIAEDGFYRRVVRLHGARTGDIVRLKSNWFPDWRARSGGREVLLYNVGGQLAFQAPAPGEVEVVLEFPTGVGLWLASWAAAALVSALLLLAPRLRFLE